MLNPYTPEKPEIKEVKMDEELLAELDEFTGMTQFIDEVNEHFNIPLIMRQRLETYIHRRKKPFSPYVRLPKVGANMTYDEVHHIQLHPLQSEEVHCDKIFP